MHKLDERSSNKYCLTNNIKPLRYLDKYKKEMAKVTFKLAENVIHSYFSGLA